jgi:hypothetical protein
MSKVAKHAVHTSVSEGTKGGKVGTKNSKNEVQKSAVLKLAEELVVSGPAGEVTKEAVAILPCTKPPKMKFIRVHETIRADVYLLKIREGMRDVVYAVKKTVATKIDYAKPCTLLLATTLDGSPFLWPLSVNDDTWSNSARKIAAEAMKAWLRVVPHLDSGTYRMRVAKTEEQEPDYKGLDKLDMNSLLAMAFDQEHVIRDMDHEVAKRLASGE